MVTVEDIKLVSIVWHYIFNLIVDQWGWLQELLELTLRHGLQSDLRRGLLRDLLRNLHLFQWLIDHLKFVLVTKWVDKILNLFLHILWLSLQTNFKIPALHTLLTLSFDFLRLCILYLMNGWKIGTLRHQVINLWAMDNYFRAGVGQVGRVNYITSRDLLIKLNW